MKKTFLVSIGLVLLNFVILGQTTNEELKQLQNQIDTLRIADKNLNLIILNANSKIKHLIKEVATAKDSITYLKNELTQEKSNFQKLSDNLGIQIQQTNTKAQSDITIVNKTIRNNTLYWITAVIFIALFSGLLFTIVRKQLSKEKIDIFSKIQQTKKILEEEGIKLDDKLIVLLDKQMSVMKENKISVPSTKAEEINHELALKVADEIIRIQKNLGNMDADTRGLKQLVASIKRIQDNFVANGYELVDMLNKPYDTGMKVVVANSVPDENLKEGEQIISKIIKPQVNFKGVMIQSAQVEVSVG